ncbi:hypothetical protein [Aequorivita viscosa]|uniref:Phenylalanyl-tRNA synthetase subunit alpha n=1 Tax=Aequorivita viscosa TaxID=797419 RepID=A0A1M6MSJ3_9FLAO|nr:hypothetical protein [Aequorivita viscosa]SDX38063.1 hypothetical protein SAMN05216556_12734 [Aequorivita viscosa]SHJ86382.1 hypothetical protein SAMN04487908_12911 [Aequorivita viscosa]
MRKDIDIPQVENVHIVAVKEWNEELTDQFWNVYVVNNRKEEISMVLVISRGSDADRKTSTIRQNLGDIQSQNSVKVEFIANEVLEFTNEYLVTFFAENTLFERKFIFESNSISDEKVVPIPVLANDGILAK